MFSSGPNYNKLKTNLRLTINRLKLLEKKKTELALKQRTEIADYLKTNKVERAKIRVEHIIREDYLVEAMEILEMYCDLLLARFGLIQQMKELDMGLAEAIASIIWITPRLQSDVQELKVVSDQLTVKYGRPYAMECVGNKNGQVAEGLMHKMSVQAPPKLTVERYLIEIAKYYNVDYEPDTQILQHDEAFAADHLIDLGPAPPLPNKNDFNSGGSGGGNGVNGGGGGGGFSYPPQQPMAGAPAGSGAGSFQYPPAGGAAGGVPFQYPQQPGPVAGPVPYPPPPGGATAAVAASAGASAMCPTGVGEMKEFESKYPDANRDPMHGMHEEGPPPYFPPTDSKEDEFKSPRDKMHPSPTSPPASSVSGSQLPGPSTASNDLDAGLPDLPELPGVPDDLPSSKPDVGGASGGGDDAGGDDIDIDDITRRFEALKKKK